jgi:hypothetical protein
VKKPAEQFHQIQVILIGNYFSNFYALALICNSTTEIFNNSNAPPKFKLKV